MVFTIGGVYSPSSNSTIGVGISGIGIFLVVGDVVGRLLENFTLGDVYILSGLLDDLYVVASTLGLGDLFLRRLVGSVCCLITYDSCLSTFIFYALMGANGDSGSGSVKVYTIPTATLIADSLEESTCIFVCFVKINCIVHVLLTCFSDLDGVKYLVFHLQSKVTPSHSMICVLLYFFALTL